MYIVIWDDRANYDHCYFVRSNDGGRTFLPNVRIDHHLAGGRPSLALGRDGVIHVAWNNANDSGGNYVHYAKSTDGGLTFTSSVRADDSSTVHQTPTPTIGTSRNGSRVYVARIRHNAAVLSRSVDGGRTFMSPDVRVSHDTTTMKELPSIAICSDSIVMVTWDDWGNVWFARSTDWGSTFAPETVFSESAYSASSCIVSDSLGRVYVAWSGYGIWLTISRDQGETFSRPWMIPGTLRGLRPSLWVLPDSSVYVAWEWLEGNLDVRMSYSPNCGRTFWPPVDPSDAVERADEHVPVVAVNERKEAFCAWSDYRNDTLGFNTDVYFARGVASAIEGPPRLPLLMIPCQVAPNPARGVLKLTYEPPSTGFVSAGVFNSLGRRVATLRSGFEESGRREVIWDCSDAQGNKVSPGAYFFRVESQEGIGTAEVLLLGN